MLSIKNCPMIKRKQKDIVCQQTPLFPPSCLQAYETCVYLVWLWRHGLWDPSAERRVSQHIYLLSASFQYLCLSIFLFPPSSTACKQSSYTYFGRRFARFSSQVLYPHSALFLSAFVFNTSFSKLREMRADQAFYSTWKLSQLCQANAAELDGHWWDTWRGSRPKLDSSSHMWHRFLFAMKQQVKNSKLNPSGSHPVDMCNKIRSRNTQTTRGFYSGP